MPETNDDDAPFASTRETRERTERRKNMDQMTNQRYPISPEIERRSLHEVSRMLASRLAEKGRGIIVSRHEILGICAEEWHELTLAVGDKSASLGVHVADELIDLAVAAIVGLMSIRTGKVEW